MATKRKVKRTLAKMMLIWVGRLLLGRVQRQSLKSMTRKQRRGRDNARALPGIDAMSGLTDRLRRPAIAPAPVAASASSSRSRRHKAGRGLLIALVSAAAVAALKAGVDHVIETEREHEVVTPDFDVFADDEE